MKGGSWHCTGGRDQDHPQEKNVKRQNGCLRRAYKELKEEEKLKPRRKDSESENCSVVFDSLRPHRLYSPWHSPGQNTRVSSCSILHGIVPTQGSNPGLLHCRWILYQLSHEGSPFNPVYCPVFFSFVFLSAVLIGWFLVVQFTYVFFYVI